MTSLENWIKTNRASIKSIAPIVISLVAIFALIFVLSKAIWAFKNGKANDGLKQILFGLAIVLIAGMSIVGLQALVDTLVGSESAGIKFNKNNTGI